MISIDIISVTKILATVLPSIFWILNVVIFNFRTFRINVIERRAFISGKERLFDLFYLVLLPPCILFFSYGDAVHTLSFYSPSLLTQIVWMIHFFMGDVLLVIAMWNRSNFRMLVYIPFVLLMPCYYYILIENVLTVSNIVVSIFFALLITVSFFIVFIPPNITIMGSKVTVKFTDYFIGWRKNRQTCFHKFL